MEKHFHFFVIIVTVLIAVTTQSNAMDSSYFRTIHTDGAKRCIVQYPITNSLAASLNSHRFTFASKEELKNTIKDEKDKDSDSMSNQGTEKITPVFGLMLGNPSIIVLLGGCYYSKFGFRASGGYWKSTDYGMQLDLVSEIGKTSFFSHHIGLVAGISSYKLEKEDLRKWNYVGFSYDLNWYMLFLQAGINVGYGSFINPSINFQIGLVREYR